MGPARPGRRKFRATGQEDHDPSGGTLIHQEAEEFERRGIDPVQVFDDTQHRVLVRLLPQPGEQGFQRLLMLPLGGEGERRRVRWRRQGE